MEMNEYFRDIFYVKKNNLTEAMKWLEQFDYTSAVCHIDHFLLVDMKDENTLKVFEPDVMFFLPNNPKLYVYSKKAFDLFVERLNLK